MSLSVKTIRDLSFKRGEQGITGACLVLPLKVFGAAVVNRILRRDEEPVKRGRETRHHLKLYANPIRSFKQRPSRRIVGDNTDYLAGGGSMITRFNLISNVP